LLNEDFRDKLNSSGHLLLQHQWEVRDRLGFGSGRCLLSSGQLLAPLPTEVIDHSDLKIVVDHSANYAIVLLHSKDI